MKNTFNFHEDRDRYVKRITSKIKNKRLQKEVYSELCDHIDDSVYNHSLKGMTEEAAFKETIKELGDETKLEVLLASSNKKHVSLFQKTCICAFFAICITLSYFYVDNSSYRSYLLLCINLFLIFVALYLSVKLFNVIRLFYIRNKSFIKLKKYCSTNNYKLIKISNRFSSLFKPSHNISWIVEAENKRYVIYLFPTTKSRKTLRILDSGLYSFSDNVGYVNLMTQINKHLPPSGTMFLPKKSKYLPLWHSDMIEIMKDFHLFPEVDFESHEKTDKENVRVIMLNPAPYKVVGIERGVERELKDDSVFMGTMIWSMTGFISHIKGERIVADRKNRTFF